MYVQLQAKSEYSLLDRRGNVNYRKYMNTLDFSLDLIKLREVYEKVYRRTDFSFFNHHKEYSSRVINVTFKYSVCDFNKAGKGKYIRIGVNGSNLEFEDCASVNNGCLDGIILGQEVQNPLPKEVLGNHFKFENGTYCIDKPPKTLVSTAQLREFIYNNGFSLDGVHYCRWKRSSGSSRVGKCLFIDTNLYDRMHKWESCGLKIKEGDSVDLAAFEAYISLPSSSIIDVLDLNPDNILVVDDYDSVFEDEVVSVDEQNGELQASVKKCEIKNSIWDGEGLIDISAMGRFSDKGMILLRNLFFKCCCFNTNLQQWFADNGITEISQLKGRTRATKIEDIKLITTPSSIKFFKFGSLDQWLDNVGNIFGVVKYDKKTHFFDGRLVQTHYQLLNSIQMSKKDVDYFLQQSFDYISMLKEDPAVLRYHIKYPIENEFSESAAASKNDIVYKMLGINDEFAKTQLYMDFRADLIKSMTKNLRLGHVLVNGNYETLLGNPIELLMSAIGKFDGKSILGSGNVHTTRFAYGQTLIGSRSPHISMSNVWLPQNVESPLIDKYINLTNEIICINSIGENVLNILSGSD